MKDLNEIVVVQEVDKVHKIWDEDWDIPEYAVAYLEYIDRDTKKSLNDLSASATGSMFSLTISRAELKVTDYMYTEDTIESAVMEAYNELPEFVVPAQSKNKEVVKHVAANHVARNTRRGAGKEIIDGFIIYKGKGNTDKPPTIWELIHLNILTITKPKIRYLYTIAKNQYKDRKNYPRPNVDGGLIVSKAVIEGEIKYALFKHPMFEHYGFKLKEKN
jgi:hypothetical protein